MLEDAVASVWLWCVEPLSTWTATASFQQKAHSARYIASVARRAGKQDTARSGGKASKGGQRGTKQNKHHAATAADEACLAPTREIGFLI